MIIRVTEEQLRGIVGQQIRRAVAETTGVLSVRMPVDIDAAINGVELAVCKALDRAIDDLRIYDREYGRRA